MSGEKQIEEMAHYICESRKANFADGCRVCSHHENRCLYQDIASALYREGYRKQPKWISVEDRLPEKDGCYITYTNALGSSNGVIAQSLVTKTIRGERVRRWEWQTRVSPWKVTHWMPLPEAPKMKGEGQE